MGKQDSRSKVTVTDSVADKATAEDLELVLGEVGDLLVVTAGLCVTKGNDTGNLVLDSGREVFNGTVVDSSTLTIWSWLVSRNEVRVRDGWGNVRVSTTNNGGSRALAVDVLEDTAHLELSNEIGAAGEVVGGQQSSVVDTFNGEVATVFAAELVTEGLANDGAL